EGTSLFREQPDLLAEVDVELGTPVVVIGGPASTGQSAGLGREHSTGLHTASPPRTRRRHPFSPVALPTPRRHARSWLRLRPRPRPGGWRQSGGARRRRAAHGGRGCCRSRRAASPDCPRNPASSTAISRAAALAVPAAGGPPPYRTGRPWPRRPLPGA